MTLAANKIGTQRQGEFLGSLRDNDRDRYLIALLCPNSHRDEVVALAMFNLELANAVDIPKEPILGHIRLQWWREGVEEVVSGARARAHPVLQALAPIVREKPITVARLLEMIDAREADLDPISVPDFAAFQAIADGTAGNLLRVFLAVMGHEEDVAEADASISRVATAYALVGRMRSARRDASLGRLRLPAEVLAEVGVSRDEFFTALAGSGSPDIQQRLTQVARLLGARAQAELLAAREIRLPKSALPAKLTATMAGIYLGRMKAHGFDLLDQRSVASAPWDIWRLLPTKILS